MPASECETPKSERAETVEPWAKHPCRLALPVTAALTAFYFHPQLFVGWERCPLVLDGLFALLSVWRYSNTFAETHTHTHNRALVYLC